MQKIEKNLTKIPAQITLKKIQKSDNKDLDKASVVTLSKAFLGASALRFEHVLRFGPKDKRNSRYKGGGNGLVKKAFAADDKIQDQPLCAVKIMLNEGAARNEVACYILLGREVAWGSRNGKFYVFINWVNGITLAEYSTRLKLHIDYGQAMTVPFYSIPQRIHMFIDCLQQAKTFHDLGLILGDPKSSNTMLDFVKGILILIDFDAVHRIGTAKWSYTLTCLPPSLISEDVKQISAKYTQQDDIYIFGQMLAALFPEFCRLKYHHPLNKSVDLILLDPKQKNTTRTLLLTLIVNMMYEDSSLRPSSIDECIAKLTRAEDESKSDYPELEDKSPKKIEPDKTLIPKTNHYVSFEEYVSQLQQHVVHGKPMQYPFFSVSQRINIFIGYLRKVTKIHVLDIIIDPKTHGIVHFSQHKVILNIDAKQFKTRDITTWSFNRSYLPANLINVSNDQMSIQYKRSDDIFILGHMLAVLFPEFFMVNFDEKQLRPPIVCESSLRNSHHETSQLLGILITLMMRPLSCMRPTLYSCLEKLEQIKLQTKINHPIGTAENKFVVKQAIPKAIIDNPPNLWKEAKNQLGKPVAIQKEGYDSFHSIS